MEKFQLKFKKSQLTIDPRDPEGLCVMLAAILFPEINMLYSLSYTQPSEGPRLPFLKQSHDPTMELEEPSDAFGAIAVITRITELCKYIVLPGAPKKAKEGIKSLLGRRKNGRDQVIRWTKYAFNQLHTAVQRLKKGLAPSTIHMSKSRTNVVTHDSTGKELVDYRLVNYPLEVLRLDDALRKRNSLSCCGPTSEETVKQCCTTLADLAMFVCIVPFFNQLDNVQFNCLPVALTHTIRWFVNFYRSDRFKSQWDVLQQQSIILGAENINEIGRRLTNKLADYDTQVANKRERDGVEHLFQDYVRKQRAEAARIRESINRKKVKRQSTTPKTPNRAMKQGGIPLRTHSGKRRPPPLDGVESENCNNTYTTQLHNPRTPKSGRINYPLDKSPVAKTPLNTPHKTGLMIQSISKRVRKRKTMPANELLARLKPSLPCSVVLQSLPLAGNDKCDLHLRTCEYGMVMNRHELRLHILGYDIIWNALPECLDPRTRYPVAKDAQGKRYQLVNMLQVLQSYFQTDSFDSQNRTPFVPAGSTIVEFGAGTGELGLVLAFFLQECKFVLLEANETNRSILIKKRDTLGLCNVEIEDATARTYNKSFDVGISLHSCGIETDFAQDCCIRNAAAYVLVPCCYGKLSHIHRVSEKGKLMMNVPKSTRYRNCPLEEEEYEVFATAADEFKSTVPSQDVTPPESKASTPTLISPTAFPETEELLGLASEFDFTIPTEPVESPLNIPTNTSPQWNKTPPSVSSTLQQQKDDFRVSQCCMVYIDDDRNAYAEERANFATIMAQFQPIECTPKNHVIIGVPMNRLR